MVEKQLKKNRIKVLQKLMIVILSYAGKGEIHGGGALSEFLQDRNTIAE